MVLKIVMLFLLFYFLQGAICDWRGRDFGSFGSDSGEADEPADMTMKIDFCVGR